ncbi:MAG: ABC transporter ATP-binding protein [Rhodocyclaceae bacterium]|nr:ABC transporter ATP-binding protein [Rhodocyclaceae bacterium]
MKPLIECRALAKSYRLGEKGAEIHALRGVTIDIYAGEITAIMGPSGSGKSTFMNLIGCLDTPTSGTIRIEDKDVAQLSDDGLAALRNRAIGFVFQQFNLLPRATALDNVALPLIYRGLSAHARRAHALKRLAEVGLAERAHHRPTELSGGQQQRVAIARALAAEPRLILADEPTGALDSATSIEIMALLQRLNDQGITLVLVTHEQEIAAYADRIIVFRDGRIVDDRHQARRQAAPASGDEA